MTPRLVATDVDGALVIVLQVAHRHVRGGFVASRLTASTGWGKV